jgi:hypothetical protein
MSTATPHQIFFSHKAVIVYAPQGSGKSRHAAALATYFDKTTILHECPPDRLYCLHPNTLALCNIEPIGLPYLSLQAALDLMASASHPPSASKTHPIAPSTPSSSPPSL